MTEGVAVKTLFDGAAAGYDRARRQLVPPFDDFYGAAVGAIPYEREDDIRVLDLGAGTGLLSTLVAHVFPRLGSRWRTSRLECSTLRGSASRTSRSVSSYAL